MSPRSRSSRFNADDVFVQVGPPSRAEMKDSVQRIKRDGLLEALLRDIKHLSPARYQEVLAEHGVTDLDESETNDSLISVDFWTDEWRVHWVLSDQGGTFVVRSALLEPIQNATPPGGITTNILRELSPSAAVQRANEVDLEGPGQVEQILRLVAQTRRTWGPPLDEQADELQTRGRPRIADDVLAAVARRYLEELRVNAGVGVTARVAAALELTESTTRDRIRMARERGFLSETTRGRRGGTAGPALMAYDDREGQR